MIHEAMKKILMLLTALAAWCGSAKADGLVVQNISVPQGGMAILEIALENPTTPFAAFQFNIQLAEGITVSTNDKGKFVFERGDRLDEDFSLSMSQPTQSTNTYRVLGYYTETQPIAGTTGTIIRVTIQADASLAVNSSHTCQLTAINLTEPDETKHTPDPISFEVTIDEPDDGRIKFDETSTSLPIYTPGEKGDVRMKRTINAGEWSTIVLPFTLTQAKAEAVFGADMKLAEFSGFEVNYGDDVENVIPLGLVLDFAKCTLGPKKNMTGGKPYLIKVTNKVEQFEVDDVTLVGAVTDVTKPGEFATPGKRTGTFVKSVIPANGLFISNHQFWCSTGYTNVKAFRAWFELGAVLDKETDFGSKIRFYIEDEIVDIQEMRGGDVEGVKLGWYTLDGRKLNGKPTEKGVYLVDGKKVAIY